MAIYTPFRTFIACILALGGSSLLSAQAPAPNTTQWENESLKLRLFYPSDLVPQSSDGAMQDGQLSLLGVSGATDAKLAEVSHCLRPKLVLELPVAGSAQASSEQAGPGAKITVTPFATATIALAELDVNCLNVQHPSDSANLLVEMAEIVNQVPGMRSIAPPSTYNIGWQKVHMAAAQGQPQSQPGFSIPKSSPLQQQFTMGISTNWHSHLLVWYFISNSIDTLNRMTKTTVRFGRAQAAPLYPVVIGTAGH